MNGYSTLTKEKSYEPTLPIFRGKHLIEKGNWRVVQRD
jgi:hypothetical protein